VRVGVCGKGGVGKTTISAVLARSLARSGHHVVAIDCGSDPHLAASCGVPDDRADGMRPILEELSGRQGVPAVGMAELLTRYGLTGPDSITFLLGAAVHKSRGGSAVNSYETVGEVLHDIAAVLPGAVVIADMEAGLEHLGVGNLRDSELLLVVAEAKAKSLLTASRTIALARQLGIRRVELVGNRAHGSDRQTLEAFAAQHQVDLIGVIPEDKAIIEADREGVCVFELDPIPEAVREIEMLAATIAGTVPVP